jgi:hypothetical protein
MQPRTVRSIRIGLFDDQREEKMADPIANAETDPHDTAIM